MDALGSAFFAQASSIVLLYPYRDYVSVHSFKNGLPWPDGNFFIDRYRGMLSNPSQPAILATPFATLFGAYFSTYRATESLVVAAIVGGTSFSFVKAATSVFAHRMGSTTGSASGKLHFEYSSPLDMVRASTAKHGALAWFQGGLVLMPAHVIWHGFTAARLHASHHLTGPPRFLDDWFMAARIHATGCFFSAPFRNIPRAALFAKDKVKCGTPLEFAQREVQVVRESAGAAQRVLRSEGPLAFFHGTLRGVFRTSIPFGFSFALWRAAFDVRLAPTGLRGYSRVV